MGLIPNRQVDDWLFSVNLDRESLAELIEIINGVSEQSPEAAAKIAWWVADPIAISTFVDTLFCRATEGFVQLRCFIERGGPWGRPWPACDVTDRDALIHKAQKHASAAACASERVNFCPPVVTFKDKIKGGEANICQGLAIMAELDSHPAQAQTQLEAILGEPTLVVASGGIWRNGAGSEDKRHVYWRLRKPTRTEADHKKLKRARDLACRIVGSDPTGKPLCHPLRWSGSWHRKDEPRLAQILTRSEHEVDLDVALSQLEAAAQVRGLRVSEEAERRPGPPLELSGNPDLWRPDQEAKHIVDAYLSLSEGRYYGLYGLSRSLPMSAMNYGYAIDTDELADILALLQDQNPPTTRHTGRNLRQIAESGIEQAKSNVGDDPAFKRKADRGAYYQSEMKRIRRDLEEDEAHQDDDGAAEGRQSEAGDAAPGLAERADGTSRFAAAEPLDIFASLNPQPALTRDMLPAAIAEFAFDEAERMGIEPAGIAVPCLIACAAAVDDGIKIQPKAADTRWTESARLWGAVVGDPGVKKSPAINKAIEPHRGIEKVWREEDDKALAKYKRDMDDFKRRKFEYDRKCDRGENPGGEPEEPEKPPRRRLLANEITMEGLAERILAENERGVLIVYQELMGLIGGFDAYKGGGVKKDRAAALELFDGGQRNRDLVRDTVWVPNWSAGILGGIQPDKLAKAAATLTDDGLLQRFLLVEVKSAGQGEDRKPNMDAVNDYGWLVKQLTILAPKNFHNPIVLSDAAQEHRREVESIAFALREEPSLPAAFRGHANKLSGLFARLLLTLHLITTSHGRPDLLAVVSGETARMARDLIVRFFVPHALRLYLQFFGEGASDARWIAGHILAHRLEVLTARDLQRANRTFQRSMPYRALDTLIECNWLVPIRPASGEKTTKWKVNPVVHARFAERAAEERRRREAALVHSASRRRTLDAAFGPAGN